MFTLARFKLSDRENATYLFQEPLEATKIPASRREKLQASFRHFVAHKADQFWPKHLLRINTKITTQRLAWSAQDTAVEEAEAAYAERRAALSAASSSTSVSSSTPSTSASAFTSSFEKPSPPFSSPNSNNDQREFQALARNDDATSVKPTKSTAHDSMADIRAEQVGPSRASLEVPAPVVASTIPPETQSASEVSTIINGEEREILIAQIQKVTHTCMSQEGMECTTCLFKSYQLLCVDALVTNQLRITEIADVVSLVGVLVPSKPTERMLSVFSNNILEAFIESGKTTDDEWDSVEFDERLPMKAVKCFSKSIRAELDTWLESARLFFRL